MKMTVKFELENGLTYGISEDVPNVISENNAHDFFKLFHEVISLEAEIIRVGMDFFCSSLEKRLREEIEVINNSKQ